MAKQAGRLLRTTIGVGLLIAAGCTSDDDVPDEPPADVPDEPAADEPAAESIDDTTTTPTADDEDTPTSGDRRRLLDDVEHWLYLIDVNLDADTVDEIVSSSHDIVVLDFIPSEQQNADFPMGAVVTSKAIASTLTSALHFNTYGGNPMACVVGEAVLDVIEEEKLQANCKELGDYFVAQLDEIRSRSPIVGDVRGKGLMIGVELVDDKVSARCPQSLKPRIFAGYAHSIESLVDVGRL